MSDEADLGAPSETPSGESVSGDPPEPTSGSGDEPDVDDPGGGPDGEDADAPPEGESPDHDEPSSDDAEGRRAWESLEKKYAHIEDPEARNRAVGKAYWSKANYAAQVRKENEGLKARLERLESERKAEPEPKPEEIPPHPDIVKIDQRIQTLYTKTQSIQTEQKSRLEQLKVLDREVAIAEDRLKDAFDEQKAPIEQRRDLAQQRYDIVRQQYLYGNERMEELNSKLEQELGNRDWVEKFNREEGARHQREQKEKQQLYKEFPARVDAHIREVGDEAGIPKDDKVRQSLWKHVNRAIMVELRRLNVDDVEEVDIRSLVGRYVKEYSEDRDYSSRAAFKTRSEEKLKVAGRSVAPSARAPAPAAPLPVGARPPIPVALMSNDASPAMARARQILVKRLGAGR